MKDQILKKIGEKQSKERKQKEDNIRQRETAKQTTKIGTVLGYWEILLTFLCFKKKVFQQSLKVDRMCEKEFMEQDMCIDRRQPKMTTLYPRELLTKTWLLWAEIGGDREKGDRGFL